MPIGICLFLSSIENKQNAHSAMNSGKFRLAVDLYDRQIKCNPQDANLYRNKALALMFAGQDSDAKDCIDQSLAIDQNNQLTQCIAEILDDVASGKRPRPKSMKEI
jgi:tetratricopeptide (TPR) repeat protein